MNALRDEIKHLINTVIGKGAQEYEFTDEQSLVSSGLLSSLQIVALASAIEKNYGVDFAVVGFNTDYFESLETIENLINHYRAN